MPEACLRHDGRSDGGSHVRDFQFQDLVRPLPRLGRGDVLSLLRQLAARAARHLAARSGYCRGHARRDPQALTHLRRARSGHASACLAGRPLLLRARLSKVATQSPVVADKTGAQLDARREARQEQSMTDRIVSSVKRDADAFEVSIRPRSLAEFVGQEQARANLGVFIEAAKSRGDALDHVLFAGPPGLGKTTLAQIVAKELGVGFRATSGPVISKAGDLAALLTNLEERDVLFIDEIHRLNPAVEEIL